MNYIRYWLLVIVFSGFGFAAWWFHHDQLSTPLIDHDASQPNYEIKTIRAIEFNIQGYPNRRLSAASLKHYADHELMILDRLATHLYQDQQLTWTIFANQAWVTDQGDEIILSGAVAATRVLKTDSVPLWINTSELYVFPNQYYAETDRFISFRQGKEYIIAQGGARIWFGDDVKQYHLKGRVRAWLQP
jgi:LPS export ABC transporter protein LptC